MSLGPILILSLSKMLTQGFCKIWYAYCLTVKKQNYIKVNNVSKKWRLILMSYSDKFQYPFWWRIICLLSHVKYRINIVILNELIWGEVKKNKFNIINQIYNNNNNKL